VTGPGIGHNGGPATEAGASWRRHCWGSARKALLPHLPLEVLRGRLRRAAELGLDYSTYAGIRATTGRDVVAVLFSSNALGMERGAPASPDLAARLSGVVAHRVGLATAPLRPGVMLKAPLHEAHAAPSVLASPRLQRQAIRAALGACPSDAALLVGGYEAEREWCAAARLGAYLPAEKFFAAR